MPKYGWAEIEKHNTQEDCWIVIGDKVFDVTDFMKVHPGGRWIILECAGKDASAAFYRTIHSEDALETMFSLCIGEID